MKKTILLITSVAAAAVIFSSYSTGPAATLSQDRTGSPSAAGTCAGAGCHGSQSANTSGTFVLITDKLTGFPISGNKYQAGKLYKVDIVGNGTTNNFGFQAIALNNANAQVGAITATMTGTHVPAGFSALVEHNTVLTKTGGQYEISFDWGAPGTGAGPVTFYGIINAVNGNGVAGDDQPSNTFSITLTEQTTYVAAIPNSVAITAYPNPAADHISLSFGKAAAGQYSIAVFDAVGHKVSTASIDLGQNTNIEIPSASWSGGQYFIMIEQADAKRVIPVVKN